MAMDMQLNVGMLMRNFAGKHGLAGSASGGFSFAPYKIASVILVITLLIATLYVATVYLPLKEQNNKKKEELEKINAMKNELPALDEQMVALKKRLDKSKEQYLESLAHFGNSEDLGALYQTVSTLATKYGLIVLNVKDIPIIVEKPKPKAKTPETDKDSKKSAEKKDEKKEADKSKDTAAPKKPAIDVREVKVGIELKGPYIDYIKFKEDLSLAEILLKINSESIIVKDEKTEQGNIYANLNISTYAIDKKPFSGIIAEKTGEDEQKTITKDEETTNEKQNDKILDPAM